MILNFIETQLVSNGKLVAKRCKREWFEKNGYLSAYDIILKETDFLHADVAFPQRAWHIKHNNYSCVKCIVCDKPVNFVSFVDGYRETCSNTCAQINPKTCEKIKSTNLYKYGVEYPLLSEINRNKSRQTMLKKYGVDNASKSDELNNKKKITCMENHGVDWMLSDVNMKKLSMMNKYGVDNCQKLKCVRESSSKKRKSVFYDYIISSDRLAGRSTPNFTKDFYVNTDVSSATNLEFRCILCNKLFTSKMEDGDIPSCPICYGKTSRFQSDVCEYIKHILPNTDIIENTRCVLENKKELDIYVPSKNVAIETNGLYWHTELTGGKDRNYHINKTIDCESIGIRLVHIFEDEWMSNPDIVKSKLRSIFNVELGETVYARECKIKIVSDMDKKRAFFEKNHIQGNHLQSDICIGLEFDDEIISMMSFAHVRKRQFIRGNDHPTSISNYELTRYASSKRVLGGAGKLSAFFIKKYNPNKLITYADKRWSGRNNMYEKIGFKLISEGSPSYWYVGRGKLYKRYHRYNFRKSELSKKLLVFDANLSEWENMKTNGYDRIWDCGNFKYEMVINN